MSQARNGSKVKVHYTGKLDNGEIFDSSAGREPMEFTLGDGSVIPGFEKAVNGMEVGSSKTVTIPADEAYGQPRNDLRMRAQKSDVPPDITPEIGQQLQLDQVDGQPIAVTVIAIDGDHVTLDANHPLAGKTLLFEIELIEVT